jgi:hypothetical protein
MKIEARTRQQQEEFKKLLDKYIPDDTSAPLMGFRLVNCANGRPVTIVDQTGKCLAKSSDGNWWKVVDGVELTKELDIFITSLANVIW